MKLVENYKLDAAISGNVNTAPNPISIRQNDKFTPWLDVFVSYYTPDGKNRTFELDGKKIVFETITPAGGRGVFASVETPSLFEVVDPKQGYFRLRLPDECKNGIGASRLAYFRFVDIENEAVHSTGNFTYYVEKDVFSEEAGAADPPKNIWNELDKIKEDLEYLQDRPPELGVLPPEIVNHLKDYDNPHEVNKAQVGLANVDNTADTDKAVASAQRLTTARKINGVEFDGTADIELPEVDISYLEDEISGHVNDSSAHVSQEDRVRWDSGAGGGGVGEVPWIELEPTPPWVNAYPDSHGPLRYRKFADGRVEVRGFIKKSTAEIAADQVLAIMPEGYRPKILEEFVATYRLTTLAISTTYTLFLTPEGIVKWYNASNYNANYPIVINLNYTVNGQLRGETKSNCTINERTACAELVIAALVDNEGNYKYSLRFPEDTPPPLPGDRILIYDAEDLNHIVKPKYDFGTSAWIETANEEEIAEHKETEKQSQELNKLMERVAPQRLDSELTEAKLVNAALYETIMMVSGLRVSPLTELGRIMVKQYVSLIETGHKAIEDVPANIRTAVSEQLSQSQGTSQFFLAEKTAKPLGGGLNPPHPYAFALRKWHIVPVCQRQTVGICSPNRLKICKQIF